MSLYAVSDLVELLEYALIAIAAIPAFAIVYLALAWVFTGLLNPMYRTIAHTLFRLRVYHADRVPKTGGVLLVCNHVSYLDWLVLWAACPRELSFMLWAGFYKNPILRFCLSYVRGRTVPIDNARGRPHAAVEALDKVAAALDAGRAVLVFPEQTLSRNGQMLPFGRGIERILQRTQQPVVVVPVYLRGLWGTLMSWDRGKIFFKWPRGPYRVPVAAYFGEPMPKTSTAAAIRQQVQECNANAAIRESDYLLPADRAFVRTASRLGNLFKPATIDFATGSERTLTWSKSLVGAWSLSSWFRTLLGPEQHIGVWLPTGQGSTLVNIALAFRGKVGVNLNYTAGVDPVLSAIRQSGITTVITAKRFLAKVPLELPPDIKIIHLEEAARAITPFQRISRFIAVVLFPGWFLDKFCLRLTSRLDDPLTVLFSSGSTGEPKGVVLSHRNVVGNTEGFVEALNVQKGDKMLATLPAFHTFGYTVCMWAPAIAAIQAVYFPDPRQAKEVGELCKKYGCTIMLGTATFLRFYLRRSEVDDYRSVRLLVCGAEKLPVSLAQDFHAKFGVYPLEGYGCTETSPVVSVNLHDVTVGGLKQVANRPGTVGQPIPGVAVRTFDPETYEQLPVGEEGLLGALGPNIMVGYLNQPEKTAHAIRNGWYVTGDIGLVEPDGFIRITGRVSRFAKVGGEMVPLERLDEDMHEILATGGDRVLAVAAVPDEKRGERVVVLHLRDVADRLDGIFEQLRKNGLPNLWIPDRRDCYVVESFPVLGSGKLDLRAVGILAKEVAGKR